jgi:hypothetical protein
VDEISMAAFTTTVDKSRSPEFCDKFSDLWRHFQVPEKFSADT